MSKKVLYIGIIVLCLGVTVFVMFFMNSTPEPSIDLTQTNTQTQTPVRTSPVAGQPNRDLSKLEIPAPTVYPADNKFATQILNSAAIQSLTPYDYITLTPEEVGKEDPFASY